MDNNILTLDSNDEEGCKPNKNPWRPGKGDRVRIKNESGFVQALSNITPGLLAPAPGGEITIAAGNNWTGHVGKTGGKYTYNYGKARTGPRNGTIDPS